LVCVVFQRSIRPGVLRGPYPRKHCGTIDSQGEVT
jgi:hypothetical protein